MKTDFACFDTEDDSRERVEATGSGAGKVVTQIGAIWPSGQPFVNRGDRAEFLRELQKRAAGREVLRCYALNIQYDLGNIFPSPAGGNRENGKFGGIHDLDLRFVGSRLISARWKNIMFLDVFNVWPMSVAKLGAAFGIEKLKFDARDKKYVLRDVEIIRTAMQYAEKFARGFGMERVPATLGGFCVKAWQHLGGENFQNADEFAREAYYGGRVELFSRGGVLPLRGANGGQPGELFYYTDINSLYPSVMTRPFPTDWLECENVVPAAGWGVARVALDIPKMFLAPLPVRREDLSIWYPVGKVEGTWTWHEIRAAVAAGARLRKVFKSWGCQGASPVYRHFVTTMYERRLAAKSDAEKLMLKLLMNNLYGRLGTRGLITRSLYLKGEDFGPDDFYVGSGVPYGEKHLVDVEMPLEETVNWLHAAYVTSYARLELLSWLRRVPFQNLVYADTDSMIFSCGGQLPFSVGKGLGEMKLEGVARRCLTYAPKVYVFGFHAKAKGIKKRRERSQGKVWNPAVEFIRAGEAQMFLPYKLREHVAFYDERTDADGRVIMPANTRPLSEWRLVSKRRQEAYDRKTLDRKTGLYWPKNNEDV